MELPDFDQSRCNARQMAFYGNMLWKPMVMGIAKACREDDLFMRLAGRSNQHPCNGRHVRLGASPLQAIGAMLVRRGVDAAGHENGHADE